HLHFGKSFWRRMFSVPPLSAKKLHESYKKATDRRIFVSPSTMAKSLGTLCKSSEISDKWLWIQCKNRIPLSPPVLLSLFSYYSLQAAKSFLSNFSPKRHTLLWREHSQCVEPLGSFV